MSELSQQLKTIFERLPSISTEPGCYLWKRLDVETQKSEILYVGKANNLRSRIRQYFNSDDYKTKYLMSKVNDLDYIVTKNEVEALLLESNLIKEHSPVYNVRLKDDKRYPYLCLTAGEAFPRLLITRRKTNPKNLYFGPYSDAGAARNILSLIHRTFPIRKRHQALPAKSPMRPCLNYHIGLCLAPCAEKISQSDYGLMIEKIKLFLEAKDDEIVHEMESQMKRYSEKFEYEKAAVYRDIISDIKAIYTEQSVHGEDDENNYDVVGLYGISQNELDSDSNFADNLGSDEEDGDLKLKSGDDQNTNNIYYSQIVLLRIRKGNLINKGSYALTETARPANDQMESFHSELIETFLRDHYLNLTDCPGLILTDSKLYTRGEWQKILSKKFRSPVRLADNTESDDYTKRLSLIQMAQNNARLTLRERILSEKIRNQRYGLRQIQKFLNLVQPPEMIECYDISNIQGTDAVGCGVTIRNGIPYKAGYRRYKITTKNTPDDPAMIYEVLSRRMKAFKEKTADIPDLIVIDGGITQLNAALRARTENHVSVKIVSLAKKEELITTENGKTVSMDKNSPGMLILRLARDEAHRFSVAFHRELRGKRNLKSIVDDIHGVGPVKKKKIMALLTNLDEKNFNYEKIKEGLLVEGLNEAQINLICDKII
ncbi:MAG: excinuclease ABC subunit UvrC [Spirochaetia bacterium]|nr:excinuclease ABC subunit UvrC [Spirochaetia bacterium]